MLSHNGQCARFSNVSQIVLATFLMAGWLAAPAWAQDADAQQSTSDQADSENAPQAATASDAAQDDFHDGSINYQGKIIVTGSGRHTLEMLAGTTVVEGLTLQRSLSSQLGDVLAAQPGVSTSGFSPGASRPVLRGFSGARVKVLIDGIGSIDASNVSDDHAVALDPFNAERIDVLRGPAVLLFGSQAIGGAVNVIDKRIPLRVPQEDYHFDALVSGNSVADMYSGAASLDIPVDGGFALHVDGGYHKSDDVNVPGYAVADSLRAQLLSDADMIEAADPDRAELLRSQANQRGVLLNSGTETYSANLGAAFFKGDSNIGVSMGYYDTQYGIPVRPGNDGDPVSIGLKQWRGDLRAELDLGDGFFDRLNNRVAFSHYTHTEFEGGEPGTTFNVDGMEARSELVEAERSDWSGSLGIQYTTRNLRISGEEQLLPRNLSNSFAVFAFQQIPLGEARLHLAGRFESADVFAPDIDFDRNYQTFSGALGLTHPLAEGLEIGVNASRVARAPSPEELLVDGAHDATQSYERGNPGLAVEKAVGGEAFLRGQVGEASLNLTGFYSRFTDYIYQVGTGEVIEGLPVFEFRQGDADYYGAEGELDLPLMESDDWFKLKSELRGSFVRAKLGDGGNVPRIPPLSLFGALEAERGAVTLRGELAWTAKQAKAGLNETPTDAYTFVNASIAWRPIRGNNNVTLLLKADNIFDVSGRLASSLTKDYTPLPGRNIEASLRASF